MTRPLVIMALFFVFCLLTSSAMAEDVEVYNEEAIKEKIKKVWETRIEKIGGFRANLEVNHHDLISDSLQGSDVTTKPSPEYTDYKTQIEIKCDGNKYFFNLYGARTGEDGRTLLEQDFITSYDGGSHKLLWSPTTDRKYHSGEIQPYKFCDRIKNLSYIPINVFCVPIDDKVNFLYLNNKEIVSTNAIINNKSCIHLSEKHSNLSRDLFLDKNNNYNLERYQLIINGKVDYQLDCTYQKINNLHVPKSWTTTVFYDQETLESSTLYNVTTIDLGLEIPHEEFEIKFPYGTVVSDVTSPKAASRTGTYDYIVLEDGKVREIPFHEVFLSYDELLNTKPKEKIVEGNNRFVIITPLLVINLTLIVIVISFLFFRRKSKKQTSS